MNMSSGELACILEKHFLSDLVKAFELNGRRDHNITSSFCQIFEDLSPELKWQSTQSSSKKGANDEDDGKEG